MLKSAGIEIAVELGDDAELVARGVMLAEVDGATTVITMVNV